MDRKQMFESIMRQAGLTKSSVACFYDGLTALAKRELQRNKEFVLPGLGVLRVRKRRRRTGRNPQTGETIQIPAKNVVRFRAYMPLDELLNGPRKDSSAEDEGPAPPQAAPPSQDQQTPPQGSLY